MKDFCVLIGAGASAFHSRDQTACPPLGMYLAEAMRYDDNVSRDFNNVEDLVGRNNENFEDWMIRFIENTYLYNKVLSCLSGFFLKHWNVPEDSIYLKLIKEFGTERISRTIFVSLNYESLFEIALRKKRYKIYWGTDAKDDEFNTEKDYLSETSVYKPHGSSNFRQSGVTLLNSRSSGQSEPALKVGGSSKIQIIGFHVKGGGQSEPAIKVAGSSKLHLSNVTVEGGVEVDYKGSIESEVAIKDPKKANQEFSTFNKSISVISAYEPGKSSPYSTDFIEAIRKNLLNDIKKIKKALIIGISCNEGDEFLNKIIRKITKKSSIIGYVGGESDHEKYMRLLKKDRDFFPYLGKLNHCDMGRIFSFIHSM